MELVSTRSIVTSATSRRSPAADVQQFAGSRLDAKTTSVIIVGNAKDFLAGATAEVSTGRSDSDGGTGPEHCAAQEETADELVEGSEHAESQGIKGVKGEYL